MEPVPFCKRRVFDGLHAQQPRIADHNIHPAERHRGLAEDPADQRLIRYVGRYGQRPALAVCVVDGLRDGQHAGRIDVGGHYVRASASEAFGGSAPDTTGRAGHERHLPG